MKRSERQQKRDSKRKGLAPAEGLQRPTRQTKAAALRPLTAMQGIYIEAIRSNELTFGLGPAGSGKTYIAGAMAAESLSDRAIDQIIITRPAVDAGEHLGFLPGELDQKYEPYIRPFLDVLYERLGRSNVEGMIKAGRIEAAPFAYMRGRTFKHAFVILDEAQNTTPEQMKLFLTRIGEGSRVIVNGDETQVDIPGRSGLTDAVKRLSAMRGVQVVRFTRADIVRSGLVQRIVEAYETPSPGRG